MDVRLAVFDERAAAALGFTADTLAPRLRNPRRAGDERALLDVVGIDDDVRDRVEREMTAAGIFDRNAQIPLRVVATRTAAARA